jgi:hypothetical protein
MFNVPESELANIKVAQNGSSLSIEHMGGDAPEDLKIRIYTSKLVGVMSDGGAQVYISKFPSQKQLIAQANGSSMINTGDMKIDNITMMRDESSQIVSPMAADKKETING